MQRMTYTHILVVRVNKQSSKNSRSFSTTTVYLTSIYCGCLRCNNHSTAVEIRYIALCSSWIPESLRPFNLASLKLASAVIACCWARSHRCFQIVIFLICSCNAKRLIPTFMPEHTHTRCVPVLPYTFDMGPQKPSCRPSMKCAGINTY